MKECDHHIFSKFYEFGKIECYNKHYPNLGQLIGNRSETRQLKVLITNIDKFFYATFRKMNRPLILSLGVMGF
jgi:hypothetical protein